MTRGRFIAFEGGEGAGKSTQARLLAQTLSSRDLAVTVTREPGGTPGAEAIRRLLLDVDGDGDGEGWGVRAEALLFAAARADHVERLIKPSLASGRWIVCDRFIDSSRAYQGGGGGLSDDDIAALHRIGSAGLLPDLTFLIQIDPQTAARRLEQRDAGKADRIGGRSIDYHARVADRFARIAASEPARFAVIDGNGSADETHSAIMAALASMLEQPR